MTSCETCNPIIYLNPDWIISNKLINQKKIWKQTGVLGSQYTSVKSSVSVGYNTHTTLGWNQSSDRINPSVSTRIVPSHGNSTRGTITRHRPGASAPGGIGVDVKHNSYNRHLAKIKTKNVMTQNCTTCPTPLIGNKYKMINMMSGCTKC